MWTAKTIKIMPKVSEAHPMSRFILLTLTVRNCELSDLRSQLREMHKAWTKLVKRKEWNVQGWVRTTEVTRSLDDTAHPHYHCLLMVKPSYFGGNQYVSQKRWVELWRDCLKVTYDPVVDVRVVRPKSDTLQSQQDAISAALVETVKYTVKPSDILRGDNCQQPGQRVRMSDQDWLLELTIQLLKTRAIATGGILKDYLKVLEDEPKDLIHADENGETQADEESPRVAFGWREQAKRYIMDSQAG
jgi:plasmid rolling circle replication initiator protein Rep